MRSSVSFDPDRATAGITACRTSVMLAAVPMSMDREVVPDEPGTKVMVDDPGVAPVSLPSKTLDMTSREEMCCVFRPGEALPALILTTLTGRLRIAAKETADLRICPPPSPCEPSTSRNSTDRAVKTEID